MNDVDGEITVSLLENRVIVARGRGHLRLVHVLAAQAEIERLMQHVTGPVNTLYDGTAIESFEPGLPIRWVRWGARLTERAGRVATVVRAGPMAAVAKTIPYLVPSLRFAIFTDRVAAIAFLNTANDANTKNLH